MRFAFLTAAVVSLAPVVLGSPPRSTLVAAPVPTSIPDDAATVDIAAASNEGSVEVDLLADELDFFSEEEFSLAIEATENAKATGPVANIVIFWDLIHRAGVYCFDKEPNSVPRSQCIKRINDAFPDFPPYYPVDAAGNKILIVNSIETLEYLRQRKQGIVQSRIALGCPGEDNGPAAFEKCKQQMSDAYPAYPYNFKGREGRSLEERSSAICTILGKDGTLYKKCNKAKELTSAVWKNINWWEVAWGIIKPKWY